MITPETNVPPGTKDTSALGVETRSIDYVPSSQRHGKAWHLAPVWFTGTAHLLTFSVGFIGPAFGLNLTWTLIATVLGASFGIFFSAFHSSQGPKLGLPQMIQSRGQFGYRGAVVIFAVVVLVYLVMALSTLLVSGVSISATTGVDIDVALIASVVIGIVTAVIGYNFIHQLSRWVSFAFLVVYGVLTVSVFFTIDLPPGSLSLSGFTWMPFLLQFGAVAGYLIGWAPFVSDVSRYLPAEIGVRSTFLWTAVGMWLGAIWLIGLGAALAIVYPEISSAGDIGGTVAAAGDTVFNGFGDIAAFIAIPGLLYLIGVCFYSASLTLSTIADTFGARFNGLGLRVGTVLAMGAVTLVAGMFATDDVINELSSMLVFVLFALVPWTAVNLADFYIVRRGNYSIREIFNPTGIYGRWGWRGLVSYFVGLVAMFPFLSSARWTGPIAEQLGGVDLSPFVGLPVAGGLYLILSRSLNLAEERAVIAHIDDGFDRPAAAKTTMSAE